MIHGFEKAARDHMAEAAAALLKADPTDAVKVARLQAKHGAWVEAIATAKRLSQTIEDGDDA